MLLVVIIIVIIVIFFMRKKKKPVESFSEGNVTFFSKEDGETMLKTDPDSYFENLTKLDLEAMKFVDFDEAINKISESCINFTMDQKILLLKSTNIGDNFLRKLKISNNKTVDFKKLAELEWRFILTEGDINEAGMPHTKGDVIYLSTSIFNLNNKDLIKTLIHEKIHVYERLYPRDIQKWILDNGFNIHRRQSGIINARSNPDVDGWTYINPNGKESVVLYNIKPSDIMDAIYPVDNDPSSEHPYEMFAYYIDSLY